MIDREQLEQAAKVVALALALALAVAIVASLAVWRRPPPGRFCEQGIVWVPQAGTSFAIPEGAACIPVRRDPK